MISNAKVLVEQFLTQPTYIRWVRTIPVLVIDYCLRLPSWQGWITFLDNDWNWSLLPITFSINLLSIFNRTIGLNIFGVSYEALLGLGMMIEVDILKCDSQYFKLIYVWAILIKFLRHDKFWIIALRCLQEGLSSPGVKILLHLLIDVKNSSLEKGNYEIIVLFGVSSDKAVLTCWCWAKLKDSWRACHKSSSSRQGYLLYLMVGSFLFLT